MPKTTSIITNNEDINKTVSNSDPVVGVKNDLIDNNYSVLDLVMHNIEDKQPEKKSIVSLRRWLVLLAIGLGILLAAIIFTLFFVDLMDKLNVLDFVERNPYELVFKLALELILVAAIFTTLAYLLYRNTVLPWAKDRLRLFVSLFVIVFVIAGTGLAIFQTNTFGSQLPFSNFKDGVVDSLPFRHELDSRGNLFIGKVLQNTPEFISAERHRAVNKFLWDNNYQDLEPGQPVAITYRLRGEDKVVDKILPRFPPVSNPDSKRRGLKPPFVNGN